MFCISLKYSAHDNIIITHVKFVFTFKLSYPTAQCCRYATPPNGLRISYTNLKKNLIPIFHSSVSNL